jgi:hypothetical protein
MCTTHTDEIPWGGVAALVRATAERHAERTYGTPGIAPPAAPRTHDHAGWCGPVRGAPQPRAAAQPHDTAATSRINAGTETRAVGTNRINADSLSTLIAGQL